MGSSGDDSARTPAPGIGDLVGSALWVWGRSGPRRMAFLARIIWRLWRARLRRARRQREIDGPIPTVVAISPTMRCNYNCLGCYSRGRSTEDELSTAELDALFSEAEELGVAAIVVTGGEPLLRDDMLDLVERHRKLLFVLITNGSTVTQQTAERIARSGNVMALVSIEGPREDTDGRRGCGAYDAAIGALAHLREARACFGFAATNTAVNTERLGSDEFVDGMIAAGCSVGYFTEYVPCGHRPEADWLMAPSARSAFRERVLDLRRRKPIVLIQFPHDEYGPDGRCSAAGRESLHINPQGDVEPCPFAPIARDNIRQGGLRAAFESRFLCAIREQPELLRQRQLACSLFEHRRELEELAGKFGPPGG